MESNKDEAIKCLSIAQKHRNAGNLPSARRFCQKSLNLFATPEGAKLLEIIESEASAETSNDSSSNAGSSSTKGSSSATETHPSSSGTRHRHTESTAKTQEKSSARSNGDAEKKREYTPEQAAVVKRIRTCKVTEYYEIMSLKKDCEEAEIKKAYRKVSYGCCCGTISTNMCWSFSACSLITPRQERCTGRR